MAPRASKKVTLVAPKNGITVPPTTLPPIDPDDDGGEADTIGDMLSSAGLPSAAGELDGLSTLMAELAGSDGAVIRVYRAIKNKPLAYVYTCSPETFSLDDLRDEYGGGNFRVYVHVNGKLIKNIPATVEPKARTAATPAAELDALTALREDMARQGKLIEALALRAATPPPPSPISALFGGASLPEVLTSFGTLMNLLRPATPPAPAAPVVDPNQSIEMLLKGIALAKDLQSDGGGESSMFDLVRDLIKSPILGQAIEAAAAHPPQAAPQAGQAALPRPQRRQAVGGPVTASARQPSPGLADGGDFPGAAPEPFAPTNYTQDVIDSGDLTKPIAPDLDALITHYMGVLTAQAAADADPSLYAGLIIDQLDDDILQALMDRQPDPVTSLIAAYPKAAPYREWFQEVVDYIAIALADDAGGGGGDDGDDRVESGGNSDVGGGDASGTSEALPTG